MAITPALCNSFKTELLGMATHVSTDVFKIALYSAATTLDKNLTAYPATGGAATEVASGNGYTTGGATLVGLTATLFTDTAVLDWTTDPTWAAASFSAVAAVIYNSSKGNKAVAVLDFGGTITATADTFTVTLPVPAAATGLIRIA